MDLRQRGRKEKVLRVLSLERSIFRHKFIEMKCWRYSELSCATKMEKIGCVFRSLDGGGRNRISFKSSIGAMYFGDRLALLLEDRADTTGYE